MRVKAGPWLVLAIVPFLCAATDPARNADPPTPPRFALPDSGVLFSDNFSHGLDAWKADQPGTWSIRHGMLRADLPDQKQLRSLLRAGSAEWHNYALDLDVCMMRGVDKGAIVRAQESSGIGIDLRGGTYQDVVAYLREWPLGKASAVNASGVWNHVRIEVVDDHLRTWVNGDLRLDRTVGGAPNGGIALAAYTGGAGQCTVYYDNVVVTAR